MKKITALLLTLCMLLCMVACKETPSVKNDLSDEENNDPYEKKPITYILNINSMKIHYKGCVSERKMLDENRQEYTGDIEDLLEDGYTTCKNCFIDRSDR